MAMNCSTLSSSRHTARNSKFAQLPLTEAEISSSPERSNAQPRTLK